MTRPALLMTGAYPAWDLEDLEARYRVLKLWEAPDPEAFLAEHGPEIRALATRGDLGASAGLMRALPFGPRLRPDRRGDATTRRAASPIRQAKAKPW